LAILARNLGISLAAVTASHSRAGLIATIIGLAVAGLAGRPGKWSLLLLGGLLAAVCLAGILSLTDLRAASLPEDLGIGLAIWQARASIAQNHFWLGVGSLDQALQMQPGKWGDRHILRAHNIYLQTVAERGLPATTLPIAALALLLAQAITKLTRAAPPATRTTAAITVGVCSLFAAHGVVDFSLYAPANAALLALMLGLACGASTPALPKPQGFATNAQNSDS
jgi:O-antigen ligase